MSVFFELFYQYLWSPWRYIVPVKTNKLYETWDYNVPNFYLWRYTVNFCAPTVLLPPSTPQKNFPRPCPFNRMLCPTQERKRSLKPSGQFLFEPRASHVRYKSSNPLYSDLRYTSAIHLNCNVTWSDTVPFPATLLQLRCSEHYLV
jgi:hypothetical protein